MAVNTQKAIVGGARAAADARRAADDYFRLVAEANQLRADTDKYVEQGNEAALIAAAKRADALGRDLVIAHAEKTKAEKIAGLVRAVALLTSEADAAERAGDRQTALTKREAAERIGLGIKNLGKLKVQVPKLNPNIEPPTEDLQGLDGSLGFSLKKLGNWAKKTVAKPIEKAATFVQKNAATIGTGVGAALAPFTGGASLAIGGAIGKAVQATAPKPKQPAPPGVDPVAWAQQQAAAEQEQAMIAYERQMAARAPPGMTTQTKVLLGVAGVLTVGLVAMVVTRKRAEARAPAAPHAA